MSWGPDVLGDGYEQQVLELGPDPDGEGDVRAVLVRRTVREGEQVSGAVLYVHGFSDYFFQVALADFFAERGLAFYALDLRKCGRSRAEGQTAHFVSDLALCDEELDRALDLVTAEHPGVPVVASAHSTGGLMLPLWLRRRVDRGLGTDPVAGLVLNSPWFDLQGSDLQRGPFTQALRVLGKAQPFRVLPLPLGVYGSTLHTSGTGEWDFDTALKPIDGFPVTVGWLNAVRRGHARFHRGLRLDVPALVLRSDKTHFSRRYSDDSDAADLVLDVEQIQRWSGCIGGETLVKPIQGARHDVFLSRQPARDAAYDAVDAWLRSQGLVGVRTA